MKLLKKSAISLAVLMSLAACSNDGQDSAIDSAIESTKEAASEAVEATAEMAADAGEAIADGAESAAEMAEDAGEAIAEGAEDVTDMLNDAVGAGEGEATDMIEGESVDMGEMTEGMDLPEVGGESEEGADSALESASKLLSN